MSISTSAGTSTRATSPAPRHPRSTTRPGRRSTPRTPGTPSMAPTAETTTTAVSGGTAATTPCPRAWQARRCSCSSPGPVVYLRQRSVTGPAAPVDVTTKVFNDGSSSRSIAVRTIVTDATGTVAADQTSAAQNIGANSGVDVVQSVTIANPRRWDGLADPYLYQAHVEVSDVAASLATDVVTEPLGLRTFAVANTGFWLNGRQFGLHGVNLHQDRAGAGWAVSDADHVQDLNLIKEIGATTIRMAHYQHDQKDYDLADAMGFVVWAEIPLINNITKSAAFTANVEQQLRELIRQNYNHPSIVFWGIGNEQHQLNPPKPSTTGQWHPEEYQSLFHEASWTQLQSRPYIWGTFVWNMFDFASDGRNEGSQPGINDKGLVTRDRAVRKDAFYWYKANWAATPTLYITSRRWTQRTDASTEIKVYSNAATVTATLNGMSVGSRSSTDRIFKWSAVTLQPGTNTISVTATIDGTTHIDTVTWTLG